ncbi:MAG: NADH:flavin oxidoreductase, partial [Oscillibacter sp.]|nr:NADH:flavin oxidoreductase [Oscillibacter sp.]
MKTIFDSIHLGSLRLKNRLIRSATWEALADEAGHMPETLYQTYEKLAAGGIGGIITGFTSVADNDHAFGGMARLSNDGLIR